MIGYIALVVAVLWLVCLLVQYCRGIVEMAQYRRQQAQWRSAYEREHDEGIATINAIHNWSDEVYP
jgi:hypothetical protein